MIKKIVKVLLIGLVSLLVIGYLVTMFALSPIVAKAVQELAPQVTGCEVNIESTSVSWLLDGVTVKGIVVGNPEGYKTDSAFELGEFSIHLSLLSLLTDEIVIEEIVIDGAKITLEQGLTTNNLAAIGKNVDTFIKKGGTVQETEEATPVEPVVSNEKGSAKKLIIEHFYFRNASVQLSIVGLGGAAAKIPMADIHLENVGKSDGSEGASIGDVVKEVCTAVMSAVTDVTSVAGKGLGKAGAALKDGASAIGDGAAEATKKAGDLIKGIFGGDND